MHSSSKAKYSLNEFWHKSFSSFKNSKTCDDNPLTDCKNSLAIASVHFNFDKRTSFFISKPAFKLSRSAIFLLIIFPLELKSNQVIIADSDKFTKHKSFILVDVQLVYINLLLKN